VCRRKALEISLPPPPPPPPPPLPPPLLGVAAGTPAPRLDTHIVAPALAHSMPPSSTARLALSTLAVALGATALVLAARRHAHSPSPPLLAAKQYPAAAPAADKRIELAVKMHCKSCETHVTSILSKLPDVSQVLVDLDSETAVVTGPNLSETAVLQALVAQGREAKIIGLAGARAIVPAEIGSQDEWGAAVAEFKGERFGHGPALGVLRLVQLSQTSSSVEWTVSGLQPRAQVELCVHEFGDTRQGVASVGKPLSAGGRLGSATADAQGTASYARTLHELVPVWDVIGRAVVLSQDGAGVAAAVLARSAGVGANSKKRLCTCDGVTIWEEAR
jgi:copper chaperone CopZ